MEFSLASSLALAQESFKLWRHTSLEERINSVRAIREQLLKGKEKYARTITTDMHKPIAQSLAEVEKCGVLCEYYISNAKRILSGRSIDTRWSETYVRIEPLGVILGVMPWNFPFWQVFRFAIPTLLAGNTVVVKHASNVPDSAKALGRIFRVAHTPQLYYNLPIPSAKVKEAIASPVVRGVSLTGSESAGRSVAEAAGKELKPVLLELGGSNAFIITADADLDKVIPTALNARMQNAGQSCIAAKRFMVHSSKAKEFVTRYAAAMSELVVGDPFDSKTQIGTMAREDLAIDLEKQMKESIALGAKLVCGGTRKGAFFEPTLLTGVTETMPVFQEETFGPLAVVVEFESFDQAVALSNRSNFGLGVSLFGEDVTFLKSQIDRFEEGAVFVNEMVISDPKVPFGGIKNSGFGREMSEEGMLAFVNKKSVVVK